jgi:magnesium transporter
MSKAKKQTRTQKTGLSPGSLIYTGKEQVTPVELSLIEYDGTHLVEKDFNSFDVCRKHLNPNWVQWLNVDGVHDVGMIEAIGKHFNIHPLTLEDVLNTQQRPKFEEYEHYLVVMLKMIYFNDEKREVETEQVCLILQPHLVISFQEQDGTDAFDFVRQRIRQSKGRVRRSTADYLLYALMDAIVDCYFDTLEKIGDVIEEIETQLVTDPQNVLISELHHLKRQMIGLRKSIFPMRELIFQMERLEHPLIQEDTDIYLRDLKDHVVVAMDTIETYRDLLSGLMDLYLSSVSNRMNEVMKVLTIISTLFIPVTFIAGVYGMNFDNMPELHTKVGYFILLIVMATLMMGQIVYFKRKGWL